MAVSTSNYFSNSIPDEVSVGGGNVNLFSTTTNPKHVIGYRISTADGRIFRYVHFGAAVTQGSILSQDLSESAAAEGALVVVAPASAATTTDGTSGSKYIEITEPSITKNQFAGGYLCMVTGTGHGYTYRVKGNSVTGLPDGPASGNLRLELFDPLQVTLNASTGLVLLGSKWANLEASTASTDYVVSGVSVISASANTYGWIQTKGVIGVRQDATVTIGAIVVLSATNAGFCANIGQFNTSNSASEYATEPIIGRCVGVSTHAAAQTFALVDLMLE